MDPFVKYSGLTSSQVQTNQEKFGLNVLATSPPTTDFVAFMAKFKNPLILLLLVASIISVFTGDFVSSIIITIIILTSVSIDFFQERQSTKAAMDLKSRVIIRSTVIRNHRLTDLPLSQITIDDIVVLSAGQVVPADIEIIEEKDLHIDESSLSGEPFPVEKRTGDKIFMGTSVLNGEAVGKVLAIGNATKFGKITMKLSQPQPDTNFEIGVRDFGTLVVRLALILACVIFLVNGFIRHDFLGSLIFSLALAVGLTPELLPVIVTINLSRGAQKMSKEGVIVKHLPAIQNLGSMNILCTDKTGTLTENHIVLERYENFSQSEDKKVLEMAYLNSFFQSNLKNPLDEAILKHNEISHNGWTKIDEAPFDFVRKRLSVMIKKSRKILISKGAPDSILSICSFFENDGKIQKLDSKNKNLIEERIINLSQQGFRVVAIAYKDLENKKEYSKAVETELVFCGLTAFFDPPKSSAKQVVSSLFEEGVELKILTGDNEFVTQKVCQELGIIITGITTGTELEKLDDKEFEKEVLKANLFARLTPDHKDKIILTLRKLGKVVGYMGDGINDANSLKLADVGISVNNATDVAKDSADIILLHKSLRALREGIIEGRRTFANTTKYILMGVGSNFGNMLSVSIASLVLPFIPMLPVQILLNNLLYDVSQLAIPTDNVDKESVAKPLRWDIGFIKRFIIFFGPLSSIFDLLTFAFMILVFNASPQNLRTAWFAESLITQGLIIFAVRTQKIPFFKSLPSISLIFSSLFVITSAVFLVQTDLGKIFSFSPLSFSVWMFIGVTVFCYFTLVEMVKIWFYRKTPIS